MTEALFVQLIRVLYLVSLPIAAYGAYRAFHNLFVHKEFNAFTIVFASASCVAVFFSCLSFLGTVQYYATDGLSVVDRDGSFSQGVDLIRSTDPRLTEGLMRVDFSSRRSFLNYRLSPHAAGSYAVHWSSITIPESGSDAATLKFIWWHELGHHVWYTKLNHAERAAWRTAYYGADAYVTDYARTDIGEDFADSFAQYMTGQWPDVSRADNYTSSESGKLRTEIIKSFLIRTLDCYEPDKGCGRSALSGQLNA